MVSLGAIVYLSDFGPLKHPIFPLYVDIGVVAVFSLLIYFWAQAVALPAERIQHMIDDVLVPEETAAAERVAR